MAELGISDGAGGVAVVHGVAAGLRGVGGFHDDIAAEVGQPRAGTLPVTRCSYARGWSSVSFVPATERTMRSSV